MVTDEIMNELKKMAEEAKITFKEEEYNRSLPLIQLQIKALIARDLNISISSMTSMTVIRKHCVS